MGWISLAPLGGACASFKSHASNDFPGGMVCGAERLGLRWICTCKVFWKVAYHPGSHWRSRHGHCEPPSPPPTRNDRLTPSPAPASPLPHCLIPGLQQHHTCVPLSRVRRGMLARKAIARGGGQHGRQRHPAPAEQLGAGSGGGGGGEKSQRGFLQPRWAAPATLRERGWQRRRGCMA